MSDLSPHETPQEMIDRLFLISVGERECDMSDNDLAALEWLLKEYAALTAGAQALLENADLRKEVAELRGKIAEREQC